MYINPKFDILHLFWQTLPRENLKYVFSFFNFLVGCGKLALTAKAGSDITCRSLYLFEDIAKCEHITTGSQV